MSSPRWPTVAIPIPRGRTPRSDSSLPSSLNSTQITTPPSASQIPSRATVTENAIRSGNMVNQYELGHSVGSGMHGDVRKGRDVPGNRDVAIKAIKRKGNKREAQLEQLRHNKNIPHSGDGCKQVDPITSAEKKIRKEIAIMKKCSHQNIVSLYEVIDDRLHAKIWLVMEYMAGGEIKWKTKSEQPVLKMSQIRRITRDVVMGLEYLHYQGIIHRDIKPANLLWSADRQIVKISDFGTSHFSEGLRIVPAERPATQGTNKEDGDKYEKALKDEKKPVIMLGTPAFLAPEVCYGPLIQTSPNPSLAFSDETVVTKAVDLWAFGITIYCLLFGTTPFKPDRAVNAQVAENNLYQQIGEQDFWVPPAAAIDPVPTGGRHKGPDGEVEGWEVVHVLDGLLKKKVEERMTLNVLKTCSWLARGADKMLWYQTNDRYLGPRNTVPPPTEGEINQAIKDPMFKYSVKKIGMRVKDAVRSFGRIRSRKSLGDLPMTNSNQSGSTVRLPFFPARRNIKRSENGKRPSALRTTTEPLNTQMRGRLSTTTLPPDMGNGQPRPRRGSTFSGYCDHTRPSFSSVTSLRSNFTNSTVHASAYGDGEELEQALSRPSSRREKLRRILPWNRRSIPAASTPNFLHEAQGQSSRRTTDEAEMVRRNFSFEEPFSSDGYQSPASAEHDYGNATEEQKMDMMWIGSGGVVDFPTGRERSLDGIVNVLPGSGPSTLNHRQQPQSQPQQEQAVLIPVPLLAPNTEHLRAELSPVSAVRDPCTGAQTGVAILHGVPSPLAVHSWSSDGLADDEEDDRDLEHYYEDGEGGEVEGDQADDPFDEDWEEAPGSPVEIARKASTRSPSASRVR